MQKSSFIYFLVVTMQAPPKPPLVKPRLRLEDFDDLTYETYTPHEWVALGPRTTGNPTGAVSRFFFNQNIHGPPPPSPFSKEGEDEEQSEYSTAWRHCEVVDWSDEREAFLIEWSDTHKQKYPTVFQPTFVFSDCQIY